jgi:hypothetical protein
MGFQFLDEVRVVDAHRHKTQRGRFLTRTGPQGAPNGVRTNLDILNAFLAQIGLELTVGELLKGSSKQDILDHKQETNSHQNIPE